MYLYCLVSPSIKGFVYRVKSVLWNIGIYSDQTWHRTRVTTSTLSELSLRTFYFPKSKWNWNKKMHLFCYNAQALPAFPECKVFIQIIQELIYLICSVYFVVHEYFTFSNLIQWKSYVNHLKGFGSNSFHTHQK